MSSPIAFPNLQPVSATSPDVTIRIGPVNHPQWKPDSNAIVTDAGVFLCGSDVGTLAVQHGKEIAVDPPLAADERVLRTTILIQGFALLLRQRGRVVLHASSVAIDGKVVAFVGKAGRGKSTLALALVKQGHKLVADDVTALELSGSQALGIPGIPQINVEPHVAEAFLQDGQILDRVAPEFDKCVVPVTERFLDGPAPLTHIFELDFGSSVAVARLGLSEAFATLLAHSYRALFTIREEAAHLSQLANLVKVTPVFRITVPQSLTELPAVARRVAAFVKDDTLDKEGS